jgi:solute:Na+ symporter, SSS family
MESKESFLFFTLYRSCRLHVIDNMIVVLSFVFITVLVGAVTYYYVRDDEYETADSFFLAGRELHWGIVAGSLMLTNLSAMHLVSMNGVAYTEG